MGKDARTSLRGALYRGDGAAALAALRHRVVHEALQLGGDALLATLSQELSEERCRGRARAWPAEAGYRPVQPAAVPSGRGSP